MSSNIRPMRQDDVAFVRSAWSSSYRTSHYAGMINMRDYADVMHGQIDSILSHQSTSVLVAEEEGELDHMGRSFLYGFLAFHRDLNHYKLCDVDKHASRASHPYVYYVYVKSPYRGSRYASRLFAAAGIDPSKMFAYACRTPYCADLASKIPLAQFNPLPARYL